jgi:hypothetical protein
VLCGSATVGMHGAHSGQQPAVVHLDTARRMARLKIYNEAAAAQGCVPFPE